MANATESRELTEEEELRLDAYRQREMMAVMAEWFGLDLPTFRRALFVKWLRCQGRLSDE